MARLPMLPGERELARLRPSPGAFLGRYALAVGFVAWGVFLGTPLSKNVGFTPHQNLLLLTMLYFLLAPGLPFAFGGFLYGLRRRWVRFGLTVAAAVGFLLFFLLPPTSTMGLGIAWSALCSIVAFVLVEVDRRRRSYHLSNLRMVHYGGLWDRHGWTAHYDAILDLDLRRTPFGRLLGYGTIEPVLQQHAGTAAPTKRRRMVVPEMADHQLDAVPRLFGVPRPRGVKALLEAFIQDATANEYLRAEQKTGERAARAIRALGMANVLPHRR